MKIITKMIIDRNELDSILHYRLVAEQSGGSLFQTGKIQRMYNSEFTSNERNEIAKIKAKASRWYLVELPEKPVEITTEEYDLWRRFHRFLVDNCTMYGRRR